MADPELKFRRQHRSKLAKLLKPAKAQCRQLCSALDLTYNNGRRTTNEELYMIVIEKIVTKGVSKQDLIDALDSIGHGGLAEELENESSIQDDETGKLPLNQMNDVNDFLKPATGDCSHLALGFDFDPNALCTAQLSSFDIMINDIIKRGDITRKKLSEVLEKPLVGHGRLAITVCNYDFDGDGKEKSKSTAKKAPNDAPGELKVSHSLPTTAQLSWSPLPEEKRNGVITGYKVQIEGPDLQREIQVEDAKTTSFEIPNLKPFTSYTFKVSAINKVGTGPTATVSSKTPEGAPSGAPGELKVSHSLPTTAQLTWSPLPEEKRNGVITGYKVQIVGPHSQQEIQVEDVSVEVSSLNPSTSYTFNVSSMTKAGTGPVATISTTTPNDSPKYEKINKFSQDPKHKVKRIVCNEVFKEHLKKHLQSNGMELKEKIKEKNLDDAFDKAKYDYSETEVQCNASAIERQTKLVHLGDRIEYTNNKDKTVDERYNRVDNYMEGAEHTHTKCSEWNICGGLSAKYQGVGADAKIRYTRRQSDIVKTMQTVQRQQNFNKTIPVPPKSKVVVVPTQKFETKECKVRKVKLIFPKNARIKCKVHKVGNRNPNSEEKKTYLIRDVLKDYIKGDAAANPLTAVIDGRYVWVETLVYLDESKPEPIVTNQGQ